MEPIYKTRGWGYGEGQSGGKLKAPHGSKPNKITRHPDTRYKSNVRNGALSSGPKTPEGRQRCVEAKTIHGNETRKARTDRAEAIRRLRVLK